MARIDVRVPTPDGECPASLHVPDSGGPAPAVIMFPDAGGPRETFSVMGDRLAAMGYVALVPDPYYRAGAWAPFDLATVFTDPDERARLTTLMQTFTPEAVDRDTGAFLDFLAARDEVTGEKVGITGYCMGGRASLVAAAKHPDRIGGAASFHGGGLAAADAPETPAALADRIQAKLYIAAAENDDSFPADQYERLDKALEAAGVDYTLVTYPAAHGFAVRDNPTHDADAEERHWAAMGELYAATLR
ncbi:dienelactone hydrolase family protein [Pseudonocardia sp. TRM90224]|uniref:dienelactone hydrolase family protein n=1 Tax=Pseudonocardia sp. TRM90224 TaxID=2812678 RepID=UPI001E3B4295|nr:dienelactone hydrolase family protein [Pseudonocardia sp. TRM90224]